MSEACCHRPQALGSSARYGSLGSPPVFNAILLLQAQCAFEEQGYHSICFVIWKGIYMQKYKVARAVDKALLDSNGQYANAFDKNKVRKHHTPYMYAHNWEPQLPCSTIRMIGGYREGWPLLLLCAPALPSSDILSETGPGAEHRVRNVRDQIFTT
ncbi:hypothetical protein BDW72DRAFT_175809 [Aspergillus terricola var. indicus]